MFCARIAPRPLAVFLALANLLRRADRTAADDPTVCLVEFSFAVAHGLNQIRLTVHLTV